MKVQPSEGRPAVFLDRDGVINRPILRQGRPYPPDSLEELEVYPDAASSLRRLKVAGFALVVVTNQPDVARGLQRAEVVHEINRELCRRVEVAAVYVCFHDDADGCRCRKPGSGSSPRRRSRSRARFEPQLHGGRSLARRGGRAQSRMPYRVHRSAVLGTLARGRGRGHHEPRRGGELDRRCGIS